MSQNRESGVEKDVAQLCSELEGKAQEVLDLAKQTGADMAEVSAGASTGLSVTVRKGELESVEFSRDKGFGVSVYFGQSKGYAAVSDSSAVALKKAVIAACDIAKFTQEDPYNGLAAPDLMAKDLSDLKLYHPWPLDADAARDIALACESTAFAENERITLSNGSSVNTHESAHVYANSHGFSGSTISTSHSVSCSVIAEETSGMQRGNWYTVNRDPENLQYPEEVGRVAALRAIERLGGRQPPAGSYPVLFAAEVASGLISTLLGALSGTSQYRGSTFFPDSLGKKVMSRELTVVERPHLPGELGSAMFDAEGVGTWEKPFVRDGVVENYILGSYSARKLGLATTGNAGGVHNIYLEGEQKDRRELLKMMGTGVLVTGLMGQGVNSVTGDYSRGAHGFWVESGNIAYPVDEITIAANLRNMLSDIVAIGSDVDRRHNVVSGSIFVGEMRIAGNESD